MINLLILLLFKAGVVLAQAADCENNKLSSSHPDYPRMTVYQAVICAPRAKNASIIENFEGLLTNQDYKLPIQKVGNSYELSVGTQGSYALWRDLINLNLGRAYYEERELKKAILYWKRIPDSSPYYPLAQLESNYAHIQLKDYATAEKGLSFLPKVHLASELKAEWELQRAMVELKQKKFTSAAARSSKLKFPHPELEHLRMKVAAEAWFGEYLQVHTRLSFKEKISHLKNITDYLERIPASGRDGATSYLAAEAFWHTAVAYRIEEPTTYAETWRAQLKTADEWISPFVEKSLRELKAHLSEEAFFFSIALLWEREDHQKALGRLIALEKLYPQGIYREDAYQLLGDYHFERQEFKLAIPYYRMLAGVGSESKAAYGVYKAAWSFYNAKDKWKSLRHFERLFQFYLNKDKASQNRADDQELKKEARQDLLLLISEILSSQEGINEIKIFQLASLEERKMINDLAKLYQRNGLYKESTFTWQYLLKNYMGDEHSPHWIMELAQDLYADGKRMGISESLKAQYPVWKKKYFTQSGEHHIAQEWTKIILSLHREAKKSQDPEFWKAADYAYSVYAELRPEGKEGDVWYFGAQRFQQLEKFWEAARWYQRAAMVDDYQDRDDAALSVLGIVHDQMGNLSLLPDKSKHGMEFERSAAYAQWFFQRPSEVLSKQKELARLLYAEALYFTGGHKKLKEFFWGLFNDKSLKEEAWKVYVGHNQRLLLDNQWEEAYSLASQLLASSLGKTDEKRKLLASIAQENAFQFAFSSEKTGPLEVVRKWYILAATIDEADDRIKIKAWHNYLLSFKAHESTTFSENLKKFVTEWEGRAPEESDIKELIFNIYAKALKLFEESREFQAKNEYFRFAANHTSDNQIRQSLLWDALLGHAQYHEWKKFEDRLAELEEMKSEYLMKPDYQVLLARLLFFKGDYQQSWALTQKILEGKNPPAMAWVTFSDLFREAKIRELQSDYLLAQEERFREVIWIRPLWGLLKEREYAQKLSTDINPERTPAQVRAEDDVEVKAFKELLAQVSDIYKKMNMHKQALKQAVISWIPATGADSWCRSPAVTKEAIQALKELQRHPVNSPRWQEFVLKLKEKESELAGIMDQEEKTCEKLKDETVFIGGFQLPESSLCQKLCPLQRRPATADIMQTELGHADNELIYHYIRRGSLVAAEAVAAKQQDQAQQNYYMALIRLAVGDVWNAYILLEELGKTPKWKDRVLMLKADIAAQNGRSKLAQLLRPDSPPPLSAAERELLQ